MEILQNKSKFNAAGRSDDRAYGNQVHLCLPCGIDGCMLAAPASTCMCTSVEEKVKGGRERSVRRASRQWSTGQ